MNQMKSSNSQKIYIPNCAHIPIHRHHSLNDCDCLFLEHPLPHALMLCEISSNIFLVTFVVDV